MGRKEIKTENPTQIKKEGILYNLKRDKWLFAMCLPAIIGFMIFSYFPLFGVTIAFQRYNLVKGVLGSEWIGFQNFISFFKDPYFFRLIRNTFLLSFNNILWGFPAPIVFAILLNEISNDGFKKFTQAVSYLPYFISMVVMIGILFSIFAYDGLINKILGFLGIGTINFRTDPKWFRPLYVFSGIWKDMGRSAIIYIAAIAGVNQQLYDAAEIDGCGRLGKIRHVTIPGIMPTIVILLILQIGQLMTVGFEKVFLMYNPQTYETADIIATYVYRRGIQGGNFSYSTAIGLFNSIISLVLITIANKTAKATSETSLW